MPLYVWPARAYGRRDGREVAVCGHASHQLAASGVDAPVPPPADPVGGEDHAAFLLRATWKDPSIAA
jgi:hypothetical protein